MNKSRKEPGRCRDEASQILGVFAQKAKAASRLAASRRISFRDQRRTRVL